MGKTGCILGVALFLCVGDIFPDQHKDESYFIRRAYLDVLGIVPTIDEIEWYCVYNTQGYFLAVDWLLQQPNTDPETLAKMLYSSSYKDTQRTALSDKKREEIIFYVVGKKHTSDKLKLKEAKLELIAAAKMCASGDLDVLDYMAYQLMSRTTKLTEANDLLAKLKSNLAIHNEQDAWLETLNYLLDMEDVRCK
jgi:hypothetical protein